MSPSTAPNIIVISPDSPFVRAILDASTFRKEVAHAQQRQPNSADICQSDPGQIATIANVAFWASIAVEEGRPIRGVLCVVCPDEIPSGLVLSSSQVVSVESVVALATAAPKSTLAVHTGLSGYPEIWGIIDLYLPTFLSFRIAGPGTVIASINKNVVALIHDGQISIPIPQQASKMAWMSIVADAFGSELPFLERFAKAARLLGIVASMFRHGHGGTLVVVPSASANWRNDVNIKYQFSGDQGSELLKQRLMQLETVKREAGELEESLLYGRPTDIPASLTQLKLQAADIHTRLVTDTLHQIGNLTAVDGAVLIGDDFTLYGFGAKLQPPQDDFDIAGINVLNGKLQEHMKLSEIGGTRHQSAARFVKHHNDALAFVASQDGHLTLFAWAIKEATVLGLQNLHHMIWEY